MKRASSERSYGGTKVMCARQIPNWVNKHDTNTNTSFDEDMAERRTVSGRPALTASGWSLVATTSMLSLGSSNSSTVSSVSSSSTESSCRRESSFDTGASVAAPVCGGELSSHVHSDSPSREFSLLAYEEQRQYVAKKTAKVAHAEYNRAKNRYSNVVPYDEARVILRTMPGEEGSDYINASFIDGEVEHTEKAYIATQGPMPHTFGDFWRMVWETGARIVIMLGKEKEKEKIKVDRYWPSNEGDEHVYGRMRVRLVEERCHTESSITRRLLRISPIQPITSDLDHDREPEWREVCQYQYAGWPDHGAPSTTKHVRELMQMLHLSAPVWPRPLVVHCFTEDHEILTDEGFMSLAEFKRREEACDNSDRGDGKGRPKVAAYDPKTRSFTYGDYELVVNASQEQNLVEFVDEDARVGFGEPSLVVTEGHDMYVSEVGRNGEFEKVVASKLLRGDTSFWMTTRAEAGISGEMLQYMTGVGELGLDSEEKRTALLRLVGAWLVCGTNSSSGIRLSCEVAIAEHFVALGAEWHLDETDGTSGIRIEEGALARFFRREFYRSSSGDVASAERCTPSWLFAIGKRHLADVFAGIRLVGNPSRPRTVATASISFRDDLVRLALHAGMTATYTRSDDGSSWEVHYDDSEKGRVRTFHSSTGVRSSRYCGQTWCVTVPTGLIIVRRTRPGANGSAAASSGTPFVVGNCSAGIGRTGAFVAIHITVERMREMSVKGNPSPDFNLFATVLRMRRSRAGMVQQLEQYGFCYEVVLDEAIELGLIQGTPRFRIHQRRQSLMQSLNPACFLSYMTREEDPADLIKRSRSEEIDIPQVVPSLGDSTEEDLGGTIQSHSFQGKHSRALMDSNEDDYVGSAPDDDAMGPPSSGSNSDSEMEPAIPATAPMDEDPPMESMKADQSSKRLAAVAALSGMPLHGSSMQPHLSAPALAPASGPGPIQQSPLQTQAQQQALRHRPLTKSMLSLGSLQSSAHQCCGAQSTKSPSRSPTQMFPNVVVTPPLEPCPIPGIPAGRGRSPVHSPSTSPTGCRKRTTGAPYDIEHK